MCACTQPLGLLASRPQRPPAGTMEAMGLWPARFLEIWQSPRRDQIRYEMHMDPEEMSQWLRFQVDMIEAPARTQGQRALVRSAPYPPADRSSGPQLIEPEPVVREVTLAIRGAPEATMHAGLLQLPRQPSEQPAMYDEAQLRLAKQVRKRLGGHSFAEDAEYIKYFGAIDAAHPWGTNVREGMLHLLTQKMGREARLGQRLRDMRSVHDFYLGAVVTGEPIRKNEMRLMPTAEEYRARDYPYPSFFMHCTWRKRNGEVSYQAWYMCCLAMLIRNLRLWEVHTKRMEWCDEGTQQWLREEMLRYLSHRGEEWLEAPERHPDARGSDEDAPGGVWAPPPDRGAEEPGWVIQDGPDELPWCFSPDSDEEGE